MLIRAEVDTKRKGATSFANDEQRWEEVARRVNTRGNRQQEARTGKSCKQYFSTIRASNSAHQLVRPSMYACRQLSDVWFNQTCMLMLLVSCCCAGSDRVQAQVQQDWHRRGK